jgi:hypothetical protein
MTTIERPAPLFPDVTFAMLSWKAPATVAHTLASYRSADILDLFGHNRIHFNEIGPADEAIARAFGFTISGTADNRGIFGGVDALARLTTTPYFLLVENDCPLDTDRAGLIAMMTSALADMATLDVPVFMMRSRGNPGEPFWRRARYERRFQIRWPLGSEDLQPRRPAHALIRAYEDRRRPSLRGSAIYAEVDPTLRHPGIIRRSPNGNWLTRSRYLQWSNCCFLAKTDFLRDVILDRVRNFPSSTTLNGHQDIEAALKERRWWRHINVAIGQSEPGPFTHQRLDR